MRTLIVAATRMEIQATLNEFQINKLNEDLYTTTFLHFGHVDFLITGVGIPFTIYNLMEQLNKTQYDRVINAGVAGSYNPMYAVGSLHCINQEEFADIGIEDRQNFYTIFERNLADLNFHPFKNGKLHSPGLGIAAIDALPQVRSITVNTTHGDEETITMFREKFHPDVENMEGAAVFYVCLKKNIPVTEIRSISNMVEVRSRAKWDLPLATDVLNSFLKHMLNNCR